MWDLLFTLIFGYTLICMSVPLIVMQVIGVKYSDYKGKFWVSVFLIAIAPVTSGMSLFFIYYVISE